MVTFIEPLFKVPDKIMFGWTPEPLSGVQGYKVYVGQVPLASALSILESNVSPIPSNDTPSLKKVSYTATIESVRTLLGISSTLDFSNLLLYWAITYINAAGSSSSIADSRVVEVPPVGILGKTKKEDPTTNRNIFVFSDELQKWTKGAASGDGALITDACDLYKANITTEYTYVDGTNVSTMKSYFTDRTTAGSPAKLTTCSYTGSQLIKMIITDSTV
jgi:hypothetical protein